MLKRILGGLLVLLAVFFGIGFFSEEEGEEYEPSHSAHLIGQSGDPDQTWSIYWYLCGSDLETDAGLASDDLEEMLEVDLPANVQLVIQTGGAWEWMNDFVDDTCIQRFLYSQNGLELVDERPLANMGQASTLADFPSFAATNYPADRTAVIFWDHGGGTVAGAAFDELYQYDSLTLREFSEAFRSVFDPAKGNPPIDVIGFDTCLMASIDTAAAFADVAHYLVAPEKGWMTAAWPTKI